jgi:hypothetical protein
VAAWGYQMCSTRCVTFWKRTLLCENWGCPSTGKDSTVTNILVEKRPIWPIMHDALGEKGLPTLPAAEFQIDAVTYSLGTHIA